MFADIWAVDASASSTYKTAVPDGFTIQYADGSGASGDYFTDDFTIGDITVSDLQMGIADRTAIGTGILGIGFELNEAAEKTYSNLVSAMVDQGKINTMAYSLYLNDYFSSTGSILFGGVDTEKFVGDLMAVPILTDAQSKNYSSLTVGLTGLSFSFPNGTTYNASLTAEDSGLKSILDSGTTLSYLPDAIAMSLFEAMGAYQDTSSSESTGLALVDCNLDVSFTFAVNNSIAITIPSDELVIDALQGIPLSSDVPFSSPCLFGIQSIGDTSSDESSGSSSARTADYALLGDTFLRSAYIVYDLDNLQIGLAPANLNSTSSNVQELKAGTSALPAFSGVASQAASSGSSTGTSTASHTATKGTGTSAASGEGTLLLLSTSAGCCFSATSVDASDALTSGILPSSAPSVGTTGSSALAGVNTGSVVVATAAYSTLASAESSPSSARVYGFSNTTTAVHAMTTRLGSSVASAVVFSTVSVPYTNFSAASASGSGTSAAVGQGPPELGGLFGVVGVSLAFALSGSLLFWL